MFDNPYKDMGESLSDMTDPKQITLESKANYLHSADPYDDRRVSLFAESQDSLLDQLAETKAMKKSGKLLAKHMTGGTFGQMRSQIGQETIDFDAGDEIK